MKNIYKILGLVSILLLTYGGVKAQEDWGISAEQKAKTLGVPYNDANVEAGQDLFKAKSCSACHSVMSSVPENKRKLPLAPNLGALDIQKANSDGEFFGKIHKGRGGMPPFANLSDDETWKIICYIRSFYPDYKPPAGAAQSAAAPEEKFEGTIKNVELSFDKNGKKGVVKVTGTDEQGNSVAAANVKVTLLLKRYFGKLELGSAKTGADGTAQIEVPADIPADTTGTIILMAAAKGFPDTVSTQAQFGEKLVWKNPLDGNHMWAVSAKAPLWLKITYLSVVIGVWLTILWAVFQLVRIYSLRER